MIEQNFVYIEGSRMIIVHRLLQEQDVTISKSESFVTIRCNTPEDAEDIFEWIIEAASNEESLE